MDLQFKNKRVPIERVRLGVVVSYQREGNLRDFGHVEGFSMKANNETCLLVRFCGELDIRQSLPMKCSVLDIWE